MPASPSRAKILLDRNENHYGPAPECLDVLRSLPPEVLFNYTRDFQKGYYSALSRRLADLHGVDEKSVVLGYGCEDVLKQAVHQALRPGERCFIPSASWWYYRAIADEVLGETVSYPLVPGSTAWEFDVEALQALHRKTPARIVLISSPNNPTGNLFPGSRLAETIGCLEGALVIVDEAYHGLADLPVVDAIPLAREHPNVLVLRTFSKLYGLAGVRIGYGIAGSGLGKFLQFAARNLGYNRISERLALAALDAPDYYEGVRVRMSRDRERICATLDRFEGVRAYASQANFVLATFPESALAGLRTGLEARGLFIKFLTEPSFANSVRISLGTEAETTWLLQSFEEILPPLLERIS